MLGIVPEGEEGQWHSLKAYKKNILKFKSRISCSVSEITT